MPKAKRLPYAKPTLTLFGSVRNLTGGSAIAGNDAGAGRRNSPPGQIR